MSTVKAATQDLVGNYGGFLGIGRKQAGIKDKATWEKKFSSLGINFLDSLYDTVNTAIQPGTAYANKPSDYVKQLFSGNDQDNASNLASRLVSAS